MRVESIFSLKHSTLYWGNLWRPVAGSNAAARWHGQWFRPSWRGSAAVHHLAAPHRPLRGSGNLHWIHPTAHLSSHVLCRLRRNSQRCLPRRQRRTARHALQRHLFYHRHCKLGWRLCTQRQIWHLHPGVQVHPLDPWRHQEADAQREERQEEEAPRPDQQIGSVIVQPHFVPHMKSKSK